MIWSDAPVNADTKTDINNRKPHMEWNLCLCLSCKREQNAWHQTCLCSQLCSSTTDFFFFLRADEWHIDERGGFAADEDAGNSNSCTSWGKERFHMPGGGGTHVRAPPWVSRKAGSHGTPNMNWGREKILTLQVRQQNGVKPGSRPTHGSPRRAHTTTISTLVTVGRIFCLTGAFIPAEDGHGHVNPLGERSGCAQFADNSAQFFFFFFFFCLRNIPRKKSESAAADHTP